MKDDLPDLTPYLSKKGGNSQGKGADNSAGKADISSKLSALVKKTGTLSAEDSDALVDSPASAAVPENAPQSASPSNSSSANAVSSSSSWEQVDTFSSTARLEAQAEALAQEKMFSQAAGIIEESDYAPYVDNAAAAEPAPSVVAQQSSPEFSPPSNAEINSDASASSSQSGASTSGNFSTSGSFSTSGNFSTSGTFTTKPMASRPGGPAPSLDKFKAPQARPMNTLSSGTPPVLKIPEKEAVRPPAPYTFHQPSEAPREAVVPKSMQLPTPSAPTTSTPGSSAQAKRAAEVSKDPPPSWPAQPTSPPRFVEKTEKTEKIEKKVEPQPQPQLQAQPSPRKQVQPESTAELLAKAFAEEAKALEQNSDDMLEPLSPLEQYNFSSEPTDQFNNEQVVQTSGDTDSNAKYDSPYFEPKPKGLVGFGSLLGGGSSESAPADADSATPGHSNLADLMIPTGEHQALFAPERRDQEGVSPFDEVQPQAFSDNSANYSDATSIKPEPVRVDERSAPPAFSSLFSTEIVTSGQDYSFRDGSPSEPVGDMQTESSDFSQGDSPASFASAEPFAESFAEPASEPSGVLSQSDAISKLLAAVNQEQQSNMSSDLASSFADPSFTESNFGEVEDMRTADTMFGSGGSNKGSAEELSAADAVFGAVPELAAPMLEPPSPEPAKAPVSSSAFPEQPVLGKDSLPIAFANAENFEQESLESIKLGIRKAKAEEKARKKAEEEAKLAAEQSAAAAKADEVAVESHSEPISQRVSEVAEEPAKSEPQSPKSTAKLSLTEMIELANSAKLEQVQDGKPAQADEPAKSGLASLLSSTNFDEPVSRAPSKPAVEEDDDGDSLGGAISDALDKLLAAGQEEQSQVAPSESQPQSQPQVAPTSSPSQNRLEAFASTSNQVEVEAPLTQTQANKVDALSRLLEVASKAPNKSPEDKRTPSDSASKIAAEINKPPGRVSRQVETIQASDYNQQPNQGAAMSSPFGGSSPFSSPFNSPSASQTRPASQEQSPSTSGTGMANPYDGVSSMPQATVSNDAVSARIAALNRKLEEQNRPPSASAVNMEAMAQIQQQAELQAQSQSPVQSSAQSSVGTGTGSVPSVNSLSQLPPQVDDSPSTRAELVNRILGSAKISQQGTKMPELPTRTVAETITPEQTAAIRGGKNSQTPGRTRTRVAKMPGIDLRPIIAIVVLLVVIGGGGFYAYQSGIVKFNLPDAKPGAETKASIDQMIKNGELDRAREILEGKVSSGKITASEGEKLHSIYFQQANKIDDEDPAEAVKLLEKIPSRSKKFKDAQKLLRKLKRKVKKN